MPTDSSQGTINTAALLRCAVILAVFGLLLANWRSTVGVLFASSNVNMLAFTAATVLIPIALLWSARLLPPLLRGLMWISALFLMLFAALVVILNSGSILFILHHRVEIDSLIASTPSGSNRIAAYQEETFPAGAVVRVRLEHTLIPGLLLFRDIAYVDEPDIDGLTLQSPTTVCVSFSANQPDLAGRDRTMEVLLDLGPLMSWKTPARLDASSPTQSCSRGRSS
jgi:hypothetical protein